MWHRSCRNIFTKYLHILNEPNTYMKHLLSILHLAGAKNTISDQKTQDLPS